VAQAVECLPSKCKALSSNPRTAKKTQKINKTNRWLIEEAKKLHIKKKKKEKKKKKGTSNNN
jgi:hypothetical protein